MKYFTIVSLLLIIISGCQIDKKESWTLVPYPNSVSVSPGSFNVREGVKMSFSDENLKQTVSFFENKFDDLGIVIDDNSKMVIDIELVNSGDLKSEAYEMDITKKRINLRASDAKGVFYGLMTIWQQLKFSNSMTIPCGNVKDEPRFEYRGYMLDESRHFSGKAEVLQMIDLMATFKLNTFHWHLTDSPGWRIDIKAFPKLATVGGIGNESNPNGPVNYYTQKDVTEIVNYAKERFIEVIPEIDMPGHATAANRAYPEFSGGGSKRYPNFTFNVGNEDTYEYLNIILEEVAELFPSKYIHLGGDEVHFGNEKWKTNDAIQLLMKREGLQSLVDVEHYFIRRMTEKLLSIDKKLASWDEIIESGVNNKNVLVYWWRHDKIELLEKSLSKGYSTILCPRIPLYFDFVQHNSHNNGRRWGEDFGTVENVYNYPESTHQFSDEELDLIKGIQGNLWTEIFNTEKGRNFVVFPRMMALSESAWTHKNNKDLSRFNKNLPALFTFLEEQGVYYFNSLNPSLNVEPKKEVENQ